MRTALLVAFGFLLLTVEAALATLLPMQSFAPNLMLPIVMALGVAADVHIVRGAAVSFVLGYLLDASTGNPMGPQTFMLVLSFMLARGATFRLLPQGPLFSALLTFGMALFTGFGVLALRAVFEKKSEIVTYDFGATIRVLVQSAATTGLLAPWIFGVVRRIDGRPLQKADERASMV